MPLYKITSRNVSLIKTAQFHREKELQTLVENNLPEIFGCQFVATEFGTGDIHSGRIDTLALSEDNNPVIIEYKKVESSELVNQSLYYLSWLDDHKGDFERAVHKALGMDVEVDWSNIRVICIAPGYKKFDLHAVRMMGANIELYEYKLYENKTFTLEEVFKKTTSLVQVGKTPGKKPAPTSSNISDLEDLIETPIYTFESHLEGKSDHIRYLIMSLSDYIVRLDEAIEEVPKKHYIAYKLNKNFVCVEPIQTKINLFLKIEPSTLDPLPRNSRDVTNIGHSGTGNLEYILKKEEDLPQAFELIQLALENVGG
ncbi:MAG: DUF5655 domain-containing protein [Bacteroidota bacterium]